MRCSSEKRNVAQAFVKAAGDRRIAVQIAPDGSQPLELERTKAWSYSVGNLAGLMALARIGEHVDVDLWQYETKDGRSIRKALDFLAPYRHRRPRVAASANQRLFAGHLLSIAATGLGEVSGWSVRSHAGEAPIAIRVRRRLWISPIEPINDLHRR